jgi:hypothetical protein
VHGQEVGQLAPPERNGLAALVALCQLNKDLLTHQDAPSLGGPSGGTGAQAVESIAELSRTIDSEKMGRRGWAHAGDLADSLTGSSDFTLLELVR